MWEVAISVAKDFMDLVSETTLSPFYFVHDRHQDLILMEDGALVHRSSLPKLWRESYGKQFMKWLANSHDQNLIENVIVKDMLRYEFRPRDRTRCI